MNGLNEKKERKVKPILYVYSLPINIVIDGPIIIWGHIYISRSVTVTMKNSST